MKHLRQTTGTHPRPATTATAPDSGPVVVLIDNPRIDNDALEWAAAEAAARGSDLRIVYAFPWTYLLDPGGNVTVELRGRVDAQAKVAAAVRRAGRVAPTISISTCVVPGWGSRSLVREARRAGDQALVVTSRSQCRLVRTIASRTGASLAVIGLADQQAAGSSAGRVVVDGGSLAATAFGFQSARRRASGITIVGTVQRDELSVWRKFFPGVDVRQRRTPDPTAGILLAESLGAALTVVARDHDGSSAYDVLRLAPGPVVLVGSGPRYRTRR
ncbi:hypothetical protein GCM10009630_34400 [Kribbella jejuensis]|uniref:Universal stress protein family protein n=1 Tax=Kribbella jejuensis TaxID=236068 RepID=A0A542DSZ2_9ACTN|nr:universal stress protein [Kribbella jejuensis]TQJ06221.1 universal stress protein family protein [Kribbella jejuensis]